MTRRSPAKKCFNLLIYSYNSFKQNLLTIISNRDDSLLSGNIAFSFGLTVSRGDLPGIMGETYFFGILGET